MGWRLPLIDRLSHAVCKDGGCAFSRGGEIGSEATALGAMALYGAREGGGADGADTSRLEQAVAKGLATLAKMQRDDGRVPVAASLDGPSWTTALAIAAWQSCGAAAASRHLPNVLRAREWLLRHRGSPTESPGVGEHHDTSLVGWSWVEGTHSWVEPTAYALLALRGTHDEQHPTAREAVRLLLDRAIGGGGWNYGNRNVLEHELRPFPETTGVVLAALNGDGFCEVVERGLCWIAAELPGLRTPMALGWGVIALRLWNRLATLGDVEGVLAESARRFAARSGNDADAALLLLAGAARCPFECDAEPPARRAEVVHGARE